MSFRERYPRLHRLLRWLVALGVLTMIVGLLAVLFWLRAALYHRFFQFPEEEEAWADLRRQRQPVSETTEWREFRGILHSHSELSHDCEVPFADILQALKNAGLDFIALSDHTDAGRADFNAQWRGLHEGKLFIPGFEMRDGFMPFGVAAGVVLSNQADPETLAKQVVDSGGLLFYAHPEEKRDWNRPELAGMEIYNLHADLKDERGGLLALLPDLLLNQAKYPEHLFRLIFDRPTANLERWDQLNRIRHITGIAGNDCHQNVGVRLVCAGADTLRIEDTSPKRLVELRLNWFTQAIARLAFGDLETGRTLLRFQLDPYERMARFVNTHVLARELTEASILDALKAGRVFVGFDQLADSAGFLWLARTPAGTTVMGESAAWSADTLLHVLSPLPCRFTVVKDGLPVTQAEGRTLTWTPSGSGNYRVEAELRIRGEWVPWVYANPIELR